MPHAAPLEASALPAAWCCGGCTQKPHALRRPPAACERHRPTPLHTLVAPAADCRLSNPHVTQCMLLLHDCLAASTSKNICDMGLQSMPADASVRQLHLGSGRGVDRNHAAAQDVLRSPQRCFLVPPVPLLHAPPPPLHCACMMLSRLSKQSRIMTACGSCSALQLTLAMPTRACCELQATGRAKATALEAAQSYNMLGAAQSLVHKAQRHKRTYIAACPFEGMIKHAPAWRCRKHRIHDRSPPADGCAVQANAAMPPPHPCRAFTLHALRGATIALCCRQFPGH